jgi:hypothetical protein
MKNALRLAVEEGDSDQQHAISEGLHHLGRLREINEPNVERGGGCRFNIKKTSNGKPLIEMKLFS